MKNGILCFVLLLAATSQSSGWGPTGHRVTGRIADRYLSKKARITIQKILQGQSLAMAGTWMDEIRSDATYDHMEDWHWVTIPHGETYASSVKNPNGDIIQTLDRVISELRTRNLPAAQQKEHLRILIHLVADLHQPLHVGAKNDRGGNNVQVTWFGNASNLHRIWDSDMIDDTRLSYTELAESLEVPSKDLIRQWQKISVEEWARESQAYEGSVYDYGKGRLGYEYAYINLPIVRQRLLQAGVRLAGILNELYG